MLHYTYLNSCLFVSLQQLCVVLHLTSLKDRLLVQTSPGALALATLVTKVTSCPFPLC